MKHQREQEPLRVSTIENTIRVRVAANKWISENFPKQRKFITHVLHEYQQKEKVWLVDLTARKPSSKPVFLGSLLIDSNWSVIKAQDPESISSELKRLLKTHKPDKVAPHETTTGDNYSFILGDGIEGAALLEDKSVDLLLTDPPYGISNPYTCEQQVSRRMRNNGTDFIMPKGHFGNWDYAFKPGEWTSVVLPKVGGWAVIFCAQAQIGEYSEILKKHDFSAVGTLVWAKTNPVPFNHRYKPINAWEALVVGKRPGTKFNGKVVHNVFTCKSPSPQRRIHPTQKPLSLIERFLELFSDQGDFVFDPFAGSATTLIASTNMDRKVVAYEKDADFYELACKRIKKETADVRLF